MERCRTHGGNGYIISCPVCSSARNLEQLKQELRNLSRENERLKREIERLKDERSV